MLGDLVQLQQVIVNLVLNGFEAMDQHKRSERAVEIETRGDVAGAEFVEIALKDRGIGLPDERADRISRRSTRQNPADWGWASRSAARSSRHTAADWSLKIVRAAEPFCINLPPAVGELVCES